MKQIRIMSRYLQLGIMLVFFAACNDEYASDKEIPGETSNGVVQVELFANTEEFQKPVTRIGTADENNMLSTMPWVLVFRGNNDNATFFEASQAIISKGKPSVPLTKTTGRSRLLIIANPPAVFFDGTADNQSFNKTIITGKLSGKTYAQALTILNTTRLSSPQGIVPYAGGDIPMSASVNLNSIDEQTTIGSSTNKIPLTRIVAKVTVENTYPGFIMEGITIIGAKQYGRFLPLASPVTSGNTVNYFAPAPADPVSGISTGKDPVYIYESVAGETSVIVKGKYDSQTGYYRLVFKDANNNLINIVRNKWYQFKIKEVKIPGYKTLAEAMVAPPSNIMSELLVINQNSMEITDNGRYYVGLSNSELLVYSNTVQNNLTAVSLTTNAPIGTLAKAEVVSVTPANSMLISGGNIVPNGAVYDTDVKINLLSQFTSGILKITVGNLVRTVRVERRSIMPRQETKTSFIPDYVSARIADQGNGGNAWLTLSTDGAKYVDSEVTHPNNPGTIYLKVGNNGTGNHSRNGGVVYLARKDSQGHLKLYINQASN